MLAGATRGLSVHACHLCLKLMELIGDDCKVIPEPAEMPCRESCGAQSALLLRGGSVHVSMCRENPSLQL